ncbi:hypothetical protein BDAP_002072 [Binucleata daphniae]
MRHKIVQHHFPLVLFPPMLEQRNLNNVVLDIIKKEPTHPPVFLASSLGFTKTNWNKSIEKLLNELGFTNRLKYTSGKNMIKYEKMKLLIMKYIEKKKSE